MIHYLGVAIIGLCLITSNRSAEAQTQKAQALCSSTLGAGLDRPKLASIIIDRCAWATLSQQGSLNGNFLGIMAIRNGGDPKIVLNRNTFIEYENGLSYPWIVWFPDRWDIDLVFVENGSSVSVKIDMEGLANGEAIGGRGTTGLPLASMGYGSILYHQGKGWVDWNMAYTNLGNQEGSLQLDFLSSPSLKRFLVLFPKQSSPVKRISISGNEYKVINLG